MIRIRDAVTGFGFIKNKGMYKIVNKFTKNGFILYATEKRTRDLKL